MLKSTNVRLIYKYSIIISAVLFLGPMVIGFLARVIDFTIGGKMKEHS